MRIPAALNGITGLKTTRGLISLHGSVALSHTLDSIGPLTRDTRDSLLLTEALSGADPLDPVTRGVPAYRFREPLAGAKPLLGTRIAVMPAAQYPIAVDDAGRARWTMRSACWRRWARNSWKRPSPSTSTT